YTFTYEDCAGNTADWTYTYTIELAPFTVPANGNSTVACIGNATESFTLPNVVDANGNTITPSAAVITENPDPLTCEGTRTYTYTYEDCAGNTANWAYTYTIDTPAFSITDPDGASTVECIGNATETFTFPNVVDACNNILSPSAAVITENPDPLTCEGTRTYTYTYEDCAGNTANWAYTYTIDTPAFSITDPDGASTVECIGDATETFTLPNVVDACNNILLPSNAVITESPDPVTCEGTRTYTYTYEDCVGNTANWAYTYTIDLLPFTLPTNGVETVDNLADAVEPTPPTVNDNCNTNIIPSAPTVSTTPTCEGEIVYTFTYEDCAGNTANWTYTYTIELAPFTVPIDGASTVACIGDATETFTLPNVVDANGDTIIPSAAVITENPDPLTCEGTRTYTYTYEDCAGNTANWAYTYTIDTPAFSITDPDGTSTVECIGDATETFTLPNVVDACNNILLPSAAVITENPDPVTCEGTRTYTYTYEDCVGNTADWAYTYTIEVTTAPVVPTNTGSTVECIADAVQPIAPTVTDACGNDIIPTITQNADPVCKGDKIYAFSYRDCTGNTYVYMYTYTIDDTTPPAPTTDITETLNVSCTDIPDAPEVTFTDNCSTDIVVVFNETNSFDENAFVDYEIVRTWTVRDECDNEEVYTQTLYVALDEVITDLTAPDWCYDEGPINMDNLLSDDLNKNGTWELLEGDPAATLNGNIFDPSGLELSLDFLPDSGGIDYKFKYTTTDQGCISITEITMNVHADCVVLPCGENDIVISKAVTPNGDAYNEFFEISGIELCGFQYDVKIFNRWGALVYESDNYQNDWNGTTGKGAIGAAGKVPNGTYYYIVQLQNSGLNPVTGPVYLGTK
ncbi:gliding motility-associated C-terminal domain-containing protein, partial [Flavivirga jejuensis]